MCTQLMKCNGTFSLHVYIVSPNALLEIKGFPALVAFDIRVSSLPNKIRDVFIR